VPECTDDTDIARLAVEPALHPAGNLIDKLSPPAAGCWPGMSRNPLGVPSSGERRSVVADVGPHPKSCSRKAGSRPDRASRLTAVPVRRAGC